MVLCIKHLLLKRRSHYIGGFAIGDHRLRVESAGLPDLEIAHDDAVGTSCAKGGNQRIGAAHTEGQDYLVQQDTHLNATRVSSSQFVDQQCARGATAEL